MPKRSDKPGPDTEMRIVAREGDRREDDAVRSPSLAVDLDRLFGAHREGVSRLVTRMVGPGPQADELVQETLLLAHAKLDTFGGGSFRAWLFAIARNLCLNARRKTRDALTSDGVVEVGDPDGGALSQLGQEERRQVVTRAASGLPETEQQAIYLRYVLEMPLPQIEERLALAPGGARVLLQRSKRHLRTALLEALAQLGRGPSWVKSQL